MILILSPLFSAEDLEKQAAQLSGSVSKVLPKELKDLKLPRVDVPPEPGQQQLDPVFSAFFLGGKGMDPTREAALE